MKPLKILVVDDDPDFAEGLRAMLEIEGHSITVAADGEEALREFRAATFGITFLDVMLPGINGVDVLGEIRRESAESRVIMMTGYSVDHLLKKAVEGGAVRVLDKPFEAGDVLRAIEEVRPE